MIKKNREKIEELSEASKVPLEHMFNCHENCSVKWCFNKRAPEEGKTYNDKDDKFCCEQNNNHLHNLLRKNIFLFQTEKIIKESLNMFDTKKRINEQCDSIRCAKKQDYGAQYEPKQLDLMRCGDIHLWIQDIH